MKTLIRQVVLSCWGLVCVPLGMATRLATEASHPFIREALQFLTLSLHWLWFIPGVGMARFLGVQNSLYDIGFGVAVKRPMGWILPAVFWFLLWHLLGRTARRMRRRKSQPTG